MTFGVGASIAQVCKFCRHSVVRTDRDFQNMGKVADLTMTPCPVAVDDMGSIDGRQMRVLGRVQLDHGAGPWDEWYIGYQDGSWGWLASAQGNWYVTTEIGAPPPLPPWDQVVVEQDIALGASGVFRVMEVKRGTMVSGEGELPFPVQGGHERYYVDLAGPNGAFATIDYGDRTAAPQLFVGYQRPESALVIKAMSERPVSEIGTEAIICPSCGGNVPALAPKKSERLGCPYCGAVSDIAARTVLEQQAAARGQPNIPLGSRGTIGGQEYVVCGYVERSATIEGEWFGWQEYLLYGPGLGFRWLVKDESTWVWITPLSIAEIDLAGMPRNAGWQGRSFHLRNRNQASVDYVLGELYWKVKVGERVEAMDFIDGGDVLSRERAGDEVAWSIGNPVKWSVLAQAFGLPENGAGATFVGPSADGTGITTDDNTRTVMIIIALIVIIVLILLVCGACGSCGGGTGGGFWGGGTWGGGRGGK
jgi:hypothetical protein